MNNPLADTDARPRPAVRLEHVTKDFGAGVLGLDDVTTEFRTGAITVLLGLSGSGKSTLLRHLNGLHRPTSGSVSVLGQDVASLRGRSLRTLRREIAVIFQHFNLIGPMSCSRTCAPADSDRSSVPGCR